jgi:hypothetical protein
VALRPFCLAMVPRMTVREQWDGGEWQEHCCRLLGAKFGEDIQFIPDRVRGDGGLEAYRLDDGTVYQCYAPQNSFSVQAQTDAQKSKIARDIHKLVSKPEDTANLLGESYRIRRWVLLTPSYDDKDLVRFARAKSFQTRMPPSPAWCHSGFEIVIATDLEHFPVELAKLNGPAQLIRLGSPEVSEQDAYTSVEEGVALRLTEKLRAYQPLAGDETTLGALRSELLVDYVYGGNQLSILEARYSAVFSVVENRARSIQRHLTRRLAVAAGDLTDFDALVKELSTHFSQDIPALAPLACDELAYYYVASWWILCPLYFRSAA